MGSILVINDEEGVDVDNSAVPADYKRALACAKAAEIARNTPDIDSAKVCQLKEQFKNGMYRVDAGSIAEAMLKAVMTDYRVTNDRPFKRAS